MSEKPADYEKLPVPGSPPSILGRITVSLASLLFLGGIALHLAYHIPMTKMWPSLLFFAAAGMLMASQPKWRPWLEAWLRDKPRAWILSLAIPLAGACFGISLYYWHPWFLLMNFDFALNLLLIALYAEAVHQERFRTFSVIALTIGWVVNIAWFYTIQDVLSGFTLMTLFILAIFLPSQKGRSLTITYRLMPAVLLSGFFLFGLQPYQYSRLLAVFSTASERMYFARTAFELGGAWGTDMSTDLDTDMLFPTDHLEDISTGALPLLGYWQGWVIAAVSVVALLVLVGLLLIQIGKSRSGPMKTFGIGAIALFSVTLLISVASTIALPISHGIPFLGFNAMTLLGIILVGMVWHEGKQTSVKPG